MKINKKNYGTSFKISIPEPCSENWDAMEPNEKGRFCNSCRKTVIDFTNQSKSEIENFIRQNQNKKICGWFRTESLDDLIITIPEEIILRQYSFQKSFLLVLLLTMGTSFISCTDHEGVIKPVAAIEVKSALQKVEDRIAEIDSIDKQIQKEKEWIKENISDHKEYLSGQNTSEKYVEKDLEENIYTGGILEIEPFEVYGTDNPENEVPFISENSFKNKLYLLSMGKLTEKDFERCLNGNLDLPIFANKRKLTFREFCKKIKNKSIKIKDVKILRLQDNRIDNVYITYKRIPLF